MTGVQTCALPICVALLNEQCLVDKEKQYINNAIEKAKLILAEKKPLTPEQI